MILEIVKKEILSHLQSFKFSALFAITLILFALNALIFVKSYEERLSTYSQNVLEHWRQKSSESIAIDKRPNPFAFVAGEGEHDDVLRVFYSVARSTIEPDWGRSRSSQLEGNFLFPYFEKIDWVFIIKLFSLFAILFTFDTISGEKERGTLALICSNSVARSSILLAKYIAAATMLFIPFVIGALANLLFINMAGIIVLGIEHFMRIGLVALIGIVYLSVFLLFGLFVSSRTHQSVTALLLLLSLWVVFVIVIPNSAGIVSDILSKAPSEQEFADSREQIEGSVWKLIGNVRRKKLMTEETIGLEWTRLHKERSVMEKQLMEKYNNSLAAKEDRARNFARLSPAALFQFASESIIDNGFESQRRFYKAAENYRQGCEDYLLQNGKERFIHYTRMVLPFFGRSFRILLLQRELPKEAEDFPQFLERSASIPETLVDGFLEMILLILWNVLCLLLAYVSFLRYDVR